MQDTDWYFIDDEGESWNDAYDDEDSPLYKYYEDFPNENLWYHTETVDRPCNSNDIRYGAIIYESQDDDE